MTIDSGRPPTAAQILNLVAGVTGASSIEHPAAAAAVMLAHLPGIPEDVTAALAELGGRALQQSVLAKIDETTPDHPIAQALDDLVTTSLHALRCAREFRTEDTLGARTALAVRAQAYDHAAACLTRRENPQ